MACDLSDIWLGDVTQQHLDTYALDTLHFSLYRDDGLDYLMNGQQEKRILKDQLNHLHPNLKNLVGGTRRLKNLQEMLLPTVQAGRPPGDDDRDAGGGPGGRVNGSYHCKRHKERCVQLHNREFICCILLLWKKICYTP